MEGLNYMKGYFYIKNLQEVIFTNPTAASWLAIDLSQPLNEQTKNSAFFSEICHHLQVNKTADKHLQFSFFSLVHKSAFSISVQKEGDITELYIEENNKLLSEKNEMASIKDCFDKLNEGFLLVKFDNKKIVHANKYFLHLTEYALNDVVDLPIYHLHPEKLHAEIKAATNSLKDLHKVETEILPFIKKDGTLIYFGIYAFIFNINNTTYICCILKEATAKKWTSALIESENSLLKKISGQFQLPHILKEITLSIESLIPSTKASILLLQPDGKHVTYGAAPNLPKGYNDALEGAEIGPVAGSCGTAMFFKQSIIVSDIETDPLWVNYKQLALAYDLKACWSTPIISANGKVLGSFALYYDHIRKPIDCELTIVKQATYLARIAIEKANHQQKLLVAKKSIIESELKYKNLFRNNPQPMWVYHVHTLKFLNVNNAAIKKYGYSRKEFLQMTILDIRPETEHTKLLGTIKNRKKALQNAGIWKHKKKDGSLIDVDITSCVINAVNEEILVLANDVTEKLISEKALINREAEFRHLFETMNQGVVYQNTNGEIVKCNKAATEILGFSEEELIELDSNNPVWRAIREDGTNFPGEEHPAMIALKTQQPVHDVVMGVYNPKKDDYVWILVHSELEYEQSSHILKRVVTTFTDITERNKHAQTLLKQNQLLKDIAWEQSHTVRAPLTRLMGLVSLLSNNDYSFAEENDPIKNESDTIKAINDTAKELDEIIKSITNKTYG